MAAVPATNAVEETDVETLGLLAGRASFVSNLGQWSVMNRLLTGPITPRSAPWMSFWEPCFFWQLCLSSRCPHSCHSARHGPIRSTGGG